MSLKPSETQHELKDEEVDLDLQRIITLIIQELQANHRIPGISSQEKVWQKVLDRGYLDFTDILDVIPDEEAATALLGRMRKKLQEHGKDFFRPRIYMIIDVQPHR